MDRSRPWLRATRRQLVIVIIVVLIGAFGAGYISRRWQLQAVQVEMHQWQATVAAEVTRTQRLQAELQTVQSPSYLEEQARGSLDMMRPGDIPVAPVAAPTPAAALVTPTPVPASQSAWQRLFAALLRR